MINNIVKNNINTLGPSMISHIITDIIKNNIEVPINNIQNQLTVVENQLFRLQCENLEIYRQLNLLQVAAENEQNAKNDQEALTIPECEVCDLSREALCSLITELTDENKDYRNAASTEATCCICFDKPRTFVNTQCGHLTSCISCVHKLNNHCPICRKVGQFIKIIVA
jgi:hypothetical protein